MRWDGLKCVLGSRTPTPSSPVAPSPSGRGDLSRGLQTSSTAVLSQGSVGQPAGMLLAVNCLTWNTRSQGSGSSLTLPPLTKTTLKHTELAVCWLHSFLILYKLGEGLEIKALRLIENLVAHFTS